MSIILSVAVPEGIVIAGDSRQTYTNEKKNTRIGSDFGSKVFQLTDRIAVATFGWAFLKPQSANTLSSMGALIEDLRAKLDTEVNVIDAGNQLSGYLQGIYDYDVASLKWTPAPQGKLAVGLHVVGYNKDSTIGEAYLVQIPPGSSQLLRNTNNAGCNWDGQTDVITRLVRGLDPRIELLPFVRHAIDNPLPNQPTVAEQIVNLQYVINWATMTLQDAIDFALFMVNSTIKMQRFSDGITMDQGDIPGCGGEVDVAVITHRDGFRWIQKKELRVNL